MAFTGNRDYCALCGQYSYGQHFLSIGCFFCASCLLYHHPKVQTLLKNFSGINLNQAQTKQQASYPNKPQGGDSEVAEIKFSNGDTEEWTRLDITGLSKRDFDQVLGILKLAISGQDKSWDQKRKCWFVKTDLVDTLMIGFRSIVDSINATRFQFQSHGPIKLLDKREKYESFDEFFNSPPPMGAQKHRTKAELIKAMEQHLKTNELFITIREDIDLDSAKKLYRKAALAFHPDRNNGDGTKMSELNIIWNELQQRF